MRWNEAVPTSDTGDAPRDLRDQFVRLAASYASPYGGTAAELIAAAVTNPGGAAVVRERFFGRRRRRATSILIERGTSAGQIRDDIDTELMVDLLFGPIVFRLFNGLGALDDHQAGAIAPMVVGAVVAAPR